MPHSFCRIWIHAIWATKERYPLIAEPIEAKVYKLMTTALTDLGCPVRIINGMPEHVHSLFLLNPQMAVSDVIKHVKGGTSHSVNQQDIIREKFAWQTGFAAYSVSESALEKVYRYIANQKEHHKKVTFNDEFDEFIRLHGLQKE